MNERCLFNNCSIESEGAKPAKKNHTVNDSLSMPLRDNLKALNKNWGKTFQISDHKRTYFVGLVTTTRYFYSLAPQHRGCRTQTCVWCQVNNSFQWCTWPWWVRIFGPSCIRGRECSTSWRTPPVDPSGDPVRKRRRPEPEEKIANVLISRTCHLTLITFNPYTSRHV